VHRCVNLRRATSRRNGW